MQGSATSNFKAKLQLQKKNERHPLIINQNLATDSKQTNKQKYTKEQNTEREQKR